MASNDRTLLQKIIDAIRDLINSIKGITNLEKDLQYIEERLVRVYESADNKKAATESGEVYKKSEYSADNIDIYTEKQYNNFGWVRYNNVLTAAEYNTLLSRYADYKHNKDVYPTTRFGEAVIHSTEHIGVIMYVKNTILLPEITKIIKINADDYTASSITEWILKNEFEQISQPYSAIEDFYGEEVLGRYRKRDFASFQKYRTEQERRNSEESNTNSRTGSNRKTSIQPNKANDSAGLNESAFSMPENESFSSDNLDTDYLKAVESEDMETAQKMVDNAAKESGVILDENGNPLKLYRGTQGGQTVFAKEKTYKGKIYTIDNIDIATKYGDKSGKATEIEYQTEGEPTTYALYGFPKKMLTIDAQYGVWSDLVIPKELLKYADGRYKATNAEIAEWAEAEGYDALRINNVRDGNIFAAGDEVIFFNENLVKSADAITKDNNGNVIPLSERFNENEADIRYSSDDLSALQRDLYDRHKNGEITNEEYLEETDKLWGKANETYGAFETGENAKAPIATPTAVAEDKPTERFTRTIIETGKLTEEMLRTNRDKKHFPEGLSLGCSKYENNDTSENVIERADFNMYNVKNQKKALKAETSDN